MKIYKIKKNYRTIFGDPNNGPCYGEKNNLIFKISDNYLSKKSLFNQNIEFFSYINKDNSFNNQDKEFIVNKLEMIKLLI